MRLAVILPSVMRLQSGNASPSMQKVGWFVALAACTLTSLHPCVAAMASPAADTSKRDYDSLVRSCTRNSLYKEALLGAARDGEAAAVLARTDQERLAAHFCAARRYWRVGYRRKALWHASRAGSYCTTKKPIKACLPLFWRDQVTGKIRGA